MALVSFKQLSAAQFESATKSNTTFYRVIGANDAESLYIGAQKLNNTQDILDALFANRIEYTAETAPGEGDAVSVKDALDDLYAQIGEGGSVASQIAAAINALDTAQDVVVASESAGVVTLTKAIAEADGVVGAVTGANSTITLAKVATTGAAEDITVTDTTGNFTGSDLETVLGEIADAIEDANDAGVVTMESNSTDAYAASYSFYQGVESGDDAAAKASKLVGTINIPKDMVVSAATLETVVTADTPYTGAEVGDTYIDLTIANATNDHIYLPVNDLIDIYTGSVGTEVTVAIDSSTNVVSATINKIAASKIITVEADAEQGISEQNLVQKLAAMESASTAAIEALDATVTQTAGTDGLALSVTEVDGVLTAVTGSIAANTYDAYGDAAAVLGTNADTAADNTVYGAKAYTDSKLTWEVVS